MSEATASPAKWGMALVFLGATLILTGLAMLLAPDGSGLDLGLLGGAAMPLGVLTALYGLSVARTRLGSAASFGEKTALLSLAVTAIAVAYFSLSMQHLGWDVAYPDRGLGGVVSSVITILLAGVIGVEILRRRESGATLEDERDIEVRRRAASMSYGLLVALLAVLTVLLGYPAGRALLLLTPAGIAHGIIVIIMLAELARHGMALWIYRRDRV